MPWSDIESLPVSSPIVEQARSQALELAGRLKEQVREQRAKTQHVSQALGYAPKYLGSVFAGRIDLKLVDAFSVLRELRVTPRSFFSRYYPLASGSAPQSAQEAEILLQVRALLVRAEGPRRVPEPEALVERALQLLRGLLVRAGKTQRGVAEELGIDRHALGQVLRRRLKLRAWHVFAVVIVTGTSPALFFHEVLALAEEERPLPGVEPGEITELLEKTLLTFAQPPAKNPSGAPKHPAAGAPTPDQPPPRSRPASRSGREKKRS
jgi:transcriptional regulator with XRE-family HTH domain